jgi:hypothetical protein
VLLLRSAIISTVTLATTLGASLTLVPPAVAATASGPEEVVLTADQRDAVGLDRWPDGPMGVDKSPGGYTFYGPNSGDIGRAQGALDNPAIADVSPSIAVQGAKQLKDVNYASGGPIFDAGGGMQLMFVHLERRPPGSDHSWYASVGLAKSTDDGHTWTFLGEILKHNLRYSAFKRSHPCGAVAEASFGQYVIRSVGNASYLYIYSPDTQSNCNGNIAVARAPVSTVVQAARRGVVSPWTKYRNGAWSEPGLGGRSSDVAPSRARRSFAIAYSSYLDRYILAMAKIVSPGVYGLEISTSTDGIHWTDPQVLFTAPAEIYAPTIVGTGSDPRIVDQQFYVYYSYSPHAATFAGYRWSDASLRRRMITIL